MPKPKAELPLINEIFSILAVPGKPADQADAVMRLLAERGHFIVDGPKAAEAHNAAQTFARRLIFSDLVVRLMRTLILGGVVMPETPQAMGWIKSYIDGDGHGPNGEAMLWPGTLLGTCALLRSWGWEPTETDPPFVRKAMTPTIQ